MYNHLQSSSTTLMLQNSDQKGSIGARITLLGSTQQAISCQVLKLIIKLL